jgi:hypothetical protein
MKLLMSYPGPIQWYHFQADLIWPDGTFKHNNRQRPEMEFLNSIFCRGFRA